MEPFFKFDVNVLHKIKQIKNRFPSIAGFKHLVKKRKPKFNRNAPYGLNFHYLGKFYRIYEEETIEQIKELSEMYDKNSSLFYNK